MGAPASAAIETTSALAAIDSITALSVYPAVCELSRPVAHQPEKLCRMGAVQRGRGAGADQHEIFFYRERQRRFQPASQRLLLRGIEGIRASQEMQPLVTLRQHRGQQIARLLHIVVHMPQQRRYRVAELCPEPQVHR